MNKDMKKVLNKMCEFVNMKYDDINFEEADWYLKHEWTENASDNFINWLTNYLLEEKEAREFFLSSNTKDKKRLKKAAREFTFNYGWKFKK